MSGLTCGHKTYLLPLAIRVGYSVGIFKHDSKSRGLIWKEQDLELDLIQVLELPLTHHVTWHNPTPISSSPQVPNLENEGIGVNLCFGFV